MKRASYFYILLSGILVSCGQVGAFLEPTGDSNRNASDPAHEVLSIKTDQTTFIREFINTSTYSVAITATAVNETDDIYYSRIGDGFGPEEQEQLFIAESSTGFLEKYSDEKGVWEVHPVSMIFVEGVRFVELTPKKLYKVRTLISGSDVNVPAGRYRLRIDSFASAEINAPHFSDYSNIFDIK